MKLDELKPRSAEARSASAKSGQGHDGQAWSPRRGGVKAPSLPGGGGLEPNAPGVGVGFWTTQITETAR